MVQGFIRRLSSFEIDVEGLRFSLLERLYMRVFDVEGLRFSLIECLCMQVFFILLIIIVYNRSIVNKIRMINMKELLVIEYKI